MKKFIYLLPLVLFLSACASLSGNMDYIPVGPQNLSARVADPKAMPVYITRAEITRPWGALGLMRIKNLPNDKEVIRREIERLKKDSAKKGADAIIVNQYFDEEGDPAYPVTLAAYLVKFLDNVTPEDETKIYEYGRMAAMENAR
ncbi:MAG: hypothetical protein LBM71_04475 [Elusimicrobiota bacterium]|jgi:hypothetical protein|nr:hypothetical protein [Elusimicrobiota bacterium]